MTGHVKFAADPEQAVHEGEIKTERIDANTIRCGLGFLQSYHEYTVELKVPFPCSVDYDKIRTTNGPFGIKVNGRTLKDDVYTILKLELSIKHQKGTVEDQLQYSYSGYERTIFLRANILDKDEGTPYLKKGIHMTNKLSEDSESDVEA